MKILTDVTNGICVPDLYKKLQIDRLQLDIGNYLFPTIDIFSGNGGTNYSPL